MKRFFLKGETANWSALNVTALNTKNGLTEGPTTEIPEDKVLRVVLAEKFHPKYPRTAEDVTEETSTYAFKTGLTRSFVLFANGKAVGWATYHRKATPRKVRVGLLVEYETTVMAKSDREAVQKALAQAEDEIKVFEGTDFTAHVEYARVEVDD